MDGLIVLVVVLLLAAPVIGIVALIKTNTDRNLLRQLDARVQALERVQVGAGAAAPATAPIVVAAAEPTPTPAPPTPSPTSVPLSSPSPVQSSPPQRIGF